MGDYDVMLVHPVCSRCHQEGPQMIPDSILVSETLSLARACLLSCPLLCGAASLPTPAIKHHPRLHLAKCVPMGLVPCFVWLACASSRLTS